MFLLLSIRRIGWVVPSATDLSSVVGSNSPGVMNGRSFMAGNRIIPRNVGRVHFSNERPFVKDVYVQHHFDLFSCQSKLSCNA